jgi:hypothetical protein
MKKLLVFLILFVAFTGIQILLADDFRLNRPVWVILICLTSAAFLAWHIDRIPTKNEE